MSKVDYKKTLSHLYKPSAREVCEVMVPNMAYLMIDGQGDPNTTPAYAEAVESLFSVSYTARFALKRATPSFDYSDIRRAAPAKWKTILRQPMQ